MRFSWKRWWLAFMAVLAALAVSVTFASPSFAAEPGEWGSWSPETVNNHNMQVASQGTLSEARNGGNLLEVWRGATNNQVWLSFNNGNAFTLGGNTATYVSPTVVAWGSDSFMVFHTGTDGNIYYTPVYGDGTWEDQWIAVDWQTTNMPVSVTQLGPGSNDLYMVYRGVGNDQRVWGTRFNAADTAGGGWGDVENIGGGTSPSAPSVVWNNLAGTLNVATRGEDNQVWMNDGWIDDWNGWAQEGGTTIDTPHIAAIATTGNMMMDYGGHRLHYPLPDIRSQCGPSY